MRKVLNNVRIRVWKNCRERRNRGNRERLNNQDVTILSMNCTGGILYHDLGLQFRSPTINLYIRAEDFIRFCENLEEYLAVETLRECKDSAVVQGRNYPVAWLGDICLFLVHYKSIPEAQEAWNKRKKRIDRNNMVIIATDRDGMTEELKDRFEKLPYQKVMFVHQPDNKHPSCFYLRGYESEKSVGIITEPTGWRGYRPIDQYDWVALINDAASQREEKT